MGKKYVIELEDKPFNRGNIDFLYRVKGFNSLVFDMTGVSKLTPYTEPDTEKVREEAYDKGYMDAHVKSHAETRRNYQRGVNDAWETARKIALPISLGGMKASEVKKMFGVDWQYVLMNCTPAKAVEKIRQHEQEHEDDHDREKVVALADDIGIHKLYALVREIRGE